MTPPFLKYCIFDPDRHGKPRWYVRRRVNGKFRKVRIEPQLPPNGVPSKEFMEAYWSALTELERSDARSAAVAPREDTFAWLWDQYRRSRDWRGYDPATRADKISVLGRWIQPIESFPFKKYRRKDVEGSRDKRDATPSAADKLVKYLRVFFAWAVKAGHMESNPAIGVEKIAPTAKGATPWSVDEIKTYRDRHALGTQARLALELMLQVGARISDAAKLGRQHEYIDRGERWIGFTAHKNRNRSPVRIDLRMKQALIDAIEAYEGTGAMTYLVTERGAAFSIKGLGNKMRDWCDQAGLKNRSAHGLRKASATYLAEDGASAHQLMAWFGWTKIETAEVYTRAAEKKRLVRGAFDLSEHRRNKSVSLSKPQRAGETNRGKNDGKSNAK